MTPETDAARSPGRIRRHLPEIGFIAASIIWAAVMIDTGDIAWPLAAWMGTALAPMSLRRQELRRTLGGHSDLTCKTERRA